jgi:4-hydroxy-tetrahydrodipicolinate reductase
MIRVAIPGCAGRMGRALVQAVTAAEGLELGGASEAAGSPAVGRDAGTVAGLPPLGITVTDDPGALLEHADGVIDFSLPVVTAELCPRCAEMGLPLVVGTTGLDPKQLQALRSAAKRIPIVFAPNMSVGVNVLLSLAGEAARLLGEGYDLEIVEAHHNRKVDAPSGTALRLAEVLAEATGRSGTLEERACYGRGPGVTGPRKRTQIGIHTVRGGDIVGEHTVLLCGDGERLELTHRASSRQTFARGALRALRWAAGRAEGFYDMQDVLGLRD